jgi:CubicO group peptidase (beta-lactamase class C family)
MLTMANFSGAASFLSDAGQTRFTQLVEKHGVPGASLAVLHDGEVWRATAGLVNRETGVEVTPESVFQIGSITKVYTTTLVMQLVDEGRLDLDEPVAKLIEEVPDGTVTLRHLLTHSSGIEGDHFIDTGRGDDAIERYVATCAELPMVHPVGATCSYCNTGFVIAGRMVEKLTGMPWHQALRTRVLEPLGLRRTTGLAEEAIRFRAAFGHEDDGSLVSTWLLPQSAAPAGSTLCASAEDLIGFARFHLESKDAWVAQMQEPQIEVPNPWTLGTHWGLGWIIDEWDGRRVIGHDGGTLGQTSFLWLVPDAGVAVAMLTNGGRPQDLYQDVFRDLMDELCGITMPTPLTPPDEPVSVDAGNYVGTYERVANRVEIDDDLKIRITITGPLAELVDDPVVEATLIPVKEDLFVTKPTAEAETWTPVVFYSLPDGTRCIHMGARATPLVTR